MTEVAIRVENLSKQYKKGKRKRYRTLRDSMADIIYAPFRQIHSAFVRQVVPPSVWRQHFHRPKKDG